MQATNKKGAPTQQAANAYAAQMKASRVAPYTWQNVKDAPELQYKVAVDALGANALQANQEAAKLNVFKAYNTTTYPQRPLPLDEKDSDVAMLYDLARDTPEAQDNNNVIHPAAPRLFTAARPYPVQDWEIQYMKDKAAAEDYAAYQTWLSNKYDLNDMATRAWFKQIAPEYFSQKRELLKELMDRHAKYSYLRMAGPENEEDLRFEYAVETGRIPIPKGPFYNPLEWLENDLNPTGAPRANAHTLATYKKEIQDFNTASYQYGLFNPVKPRTAQQSGFAGNALNPQDLVGDPANAAYGFIGQTPPTSYNWNQNYIAKNLYGNRSTTGEASMLAKQETNNRAGGYIPKFDVSGTYQPSSVYNPNTGAYGAKAGYVPLNTRSWFS